MLRRGGLALTTVSTAGCLRSDSPAERVVEMSAGFAFEPESVTVSSGTTVTWTNVGDVAHTITAYEDRIPDDAEYFASGGFDSERAARDRVRAGLVGPGGQFERTFGVRGTYEYFCVPHEGSGMTGSVRVR